MIELYPKNILPGFSKYRRRCKTAARAVSTSGSASDSLQVEGGAMEELEGLEDIPSSAGDTQQCWGRHVLH